MAFLLFDGKNKYLRRDAQGNFIPVKKKVLAEAWDNRQTAQNILKNSVSKNLRHRYRVVEVEDVSPPPIINKQSADNNQGDGNKPTQQLSISVAFKEGEVDDSELIEWCNKLNTFTSFVQEAEDRKKELSDMLSEVDQELSDIDHRLEQKPFNASQGCIYANMRRERLLRRRKIKNELTILTWLGECKVNTSMILDIKKEVSRLNGRTYQPRRLIGLFE